MKLSAFKPRFLLESVEGGIRLRASITRSVCRRLTHRVGGILQLTRGIGQVLPLLLAGELLEAPCCFLDLLRELTLRVAGAAARLIGRCETLLALCFLLLPPRELLQLLDELVDLLVGGLLVGALLHLVLVRELVHFELEQVREVVGHLLAAAAVTTAAGSRPGARPGPYRRPRHGAAEQRWSGRSLARAMEHDTGPQGATVQAALEELARRVPGLTYHEGARGHGLHPYLSGIVGGEGGARLEVLRSVRWHEDGVALKLAAGPFGVWAKPLLPDVDHIPLAFQDPTPGDPRPRTHSIYGVLAVAPFSPRLAAGMLAHFARDLAVDPGVPLFGRRHLRVPYGAYAVLLLAAAYSRSRP